MVMATLSKKGIFKMIECSLCEEKFENVHSVYCENNNKIIDYCEDCEHVYIEKQVLHPPNCSG